MSAEHQVLYSAIARQQQHILCNYELSVQSNIPQMVVRILNQLKKDTKMSCEINRDFFFHYINEDSYTYLCVTDAAYNKSLAFSFLEEIQERFLDIPFEKRDKSFAHSLNSLFGSTLKEQMTCYNSQDKDKLYVLKQKVTAATDIMVENVDKILERGEKVELLVTKTQAMSKQSTSLKKMATQVKRRAYWKNMRIKIIIALVLLLIIFFITTFACGGFTYPSCS